ncbi:MAG TPA: hypothetical protein VGR37_13640 [Longimicrobiaceae bacterium]|nr:hypothetical protein [Longimicrobiaceae bacterium]
MSETKPHPGGCGCGCGRCGSRRAESGRWYRRGGAIVVPLDGGRAPRAPGPQREVAATGPGGVIDSRIDVHAQYALLRMAKGAPAARGDGAGMLAAVKAGRLAGIYKEDQQVPAVRARALGMGWWQLVPGGEDAVLVLDPGDPGGGPPLIAFRDRVRSDPTRLDAALRRAWGSFLKLRASTPAIGRCPVPGGGGVQAEALSASRAGAVVANIVPRVFCNLNGGTGTACKQKVVVATTFKGYVALVRRAEAALAKCGHTDAEQRLHVLTGIYYGTGWSRDFDVEKSPVRNAAFQGFLAKAYGSGDDPRSCLGCGLFLSLKRSGDAGGVDMGHVLIGMSARMRFLSRVPAFPGTGSTGLEITTWVGDLGGAAARLAMDRVKAPMTPASKYFRGRDYGATSNLEGDVAAYVVAAKPSTSVGAPNIPSSGSVADALDAFFVKGTGRAARCRSFLAMLGGTFSGGKLTNRKAVRATMAAKLSAFGLMYMVNFLRQRGRSLGIVVLAKPLLGRAAEDVADLFIDKLLKCKL